MKMTAYLLGNLIFVIVWVVLFTLRPATRKLELFGSLMLLPFAITDIWFRQSYWHPPLLIKTIEPLSLETAIYCFTAGGIVMAAGSYFMKMNYVFKVNWLRVVLFLVISFALYFLFEFGTSVSSMNALNYTFLIIWLVFLAADNCRPQTPSLQRGVKAAPERSGGNFEAADTPLALSPGERLHFRNYKSVFSAVIFTVFTVISINVANIFYPNFVSSYWNLSRLWPTFLGTPTEEIFFAGILASLWTILPKYTTEII